MIDPNDKETEETPETETNDGWGSGETHWDDWQNDEEAYSPTEGN